MKVNLTKATLLGIRVDESEIEGFELGAHGSYFKFSLRFELLGRH